MADKKEEAVKSLQPNVAPKVSPIKKGSLLEELVGRNKLIDEAVDEARKRIALVGKSVEAKNFAVTSFRKNSVVVALCNILAEEVLKD